MKSLFFRRIWLIVWLVFAISGCTTVGDYYDKWFGSSNRLKPAELVALKPGISLKVNWQGNVGGADNFVFTPAVSDASVYAAGAAGQVARFDASSGKQLSRFETKTRISGGVGTDGKTLLFGTPRGEVLAFDINGKPLWKVQLASEVLSAPRIEQDIVVVRSGDSRIVGLDLATGARKWTYQRAMPPLTVRTHAGVAPYGGAVFAGYPGGRLVALSSLNGNVGWESTVALPKGATELERVADVAGLPVMDGKQICAVAYQGRVACFDMFKGSTLWARDISSVAGLGIDGRSVYVSDDKSAVVAFDKNTGSSLWKQDKLYGRSISGPVASGPYVVVADFQGYVHYLSREDGSFVARIATDGSPVIAQPMAIAGGILIQTRNGGIFSITVQ
jgi:outer membrane protein assembly factor BamB